MAQNTQSHGRFRYLPTYLEMNLRPLGDPADTFVPPAVERIEVHTKIYGKVPVLLSLDICGPCRFCGTAVFFNRQSHRPY
eukprot:COSAG05_NODE_128_length_17216_cov_2576.721038_4_plen_80_part_00